MPIHFIGRGDAVQAPVSVVYVESTTMSERKKTILDILRSAQGFVSGETISKELGISRNAVHKHIQSLRRRGFRIVGVSRRGYRLEEEPTRLSMAAVTERAADILFSHTYRYYDELASTNTEARLLAAQGAPEGLVVVTECQTAGRGRLGRRWVSPAGKGLLFSVVLRPELTLGDVHMLTLVAGVAAAEALERHVGGPVALKWPNDLFLEDRKVGGILMEVAGEQDIVEWVVLGIGLNVNTEYRELPVQLRRSATSLKMVTGRDHDRSEVLGDLLVSISGHYLHAVRSGFARALSGFRQRDYLYRRAVTVETRHGPVAGTAAGVDDHGALLVELPQRRIQSFYSGDVTLRHR